MKVAMYGKQTQVYMKIEICGNSKYSPEDGVYGRYIARLTFCTLDPTSSGNVFHIPLFTMSYLSVEVDPKAHYDQFTRIQPRYGDHTIVRWQDHEQKLEGYQFCLHDFDLAINRAAKVTGAVQKEVRKEDNHRVGGLYDQACRDSLDYTVRCALNIGVLQLHYDTDIHEWMTIPQGKFKLDR